MGVYELKGGVVPRIQQVTTVPDLKVHADKSRIGVQEREICTPQQTDVTEANGAENTSLVSANQYPNQLSSRANLLIAEQLDR